MTRQEAIDTLNGYSLMIAVETDLSVALNMAIEALKDDMLMDGDTE